MSEKISVRALVSKNIYKPYKKSFFFITTLIFLSIGIIQQGLYEIELYEQNISTYKNLIKVIINTEKEKDYLLKIQQKYSVDIEVEQKSIIIEGIERSYSVYSFYPSKEDKNHIQSEFHKGDIAFIDNQKILAQISNTIHIKIFFLLSIVLLITIYIFFLLYYLRLVYSLNKSILNLLWNFGVFKSFLIRFFIFSIIRLQVYSFLAAILLLGASMYMDSYINQYLLSYIYMLILVSTFTLILSNSLIGRMIDD